MADYTNSSRPADIVCISREEYNRLMTAAVQRSALKRAYYSIPYDNEFRKTAAIIMGFRGSPPRA